MGPLARASLVALCTCGGDLPRPAYVAQTTDDLASVEYPPPPARVERIPERPPSASAWIDGEWAWQGRRWSWKPGRWVEPPAGARFSPWTMVRAGDGTIFYAGGVWRDDQQRKVPDPPALAIAKPNPGEVEDPAGRAEQTGHTVRSSSIEGAIADGGMDGGGD